jgi:hypothetical protein
MMKRMPIEQATRVLLLAVAATPFALLAPGAALWLWLAALTVAGLLALADVLDLLKHGL